MCAQLLLGALALLGASLRASALLRPISCETRDLQALDGLWQVKVDASDEGIDGKWAAAPLRAPTAMVPVPATLNEIMSADPAMNYTDGYFGSVWWVAIELWRGGESAGPCHVPPCIPFFFFRHGKDCSSE